MKRQRPEITNLRTRIAGIQSSAIKRRTGLILAAGLLVVMTTVAYLPAMQAGYVWDDDVYVTENPLLVAPNGLWRIWFSQDSPSQYFPMVYTSFRFEYALWGLNPRGYHITNILLHAINVLLLWWVLRFLFIPGAWLAAAIFALHPVHVESVAWIAERKNLLVALFSFLSLLVWIRFADRSYQCRRAWPLYVISLLIYVQALLSKTTACTLPAALMLVLWLKRVPVDVKRWLQITPYVLLGLAMGILTVWWEEHHQGTNPMVLGLNPIESALLAGRALWFYIGKLIWPVNLTFSYPYWKFDVTNPLQYGWLLSCLIVAWGMWVWREKLGRGPIAAIMFFVAALLPMLGFLPLYTFFYTYVADHYQYVASVGPIALVAAVGHLTAARLGRWKNAIAKIIIAIVLVTLGTLTWHQCHIYKDAETLWCDTLRKNPDSWMAHTHLASIMLAQGKSEEAIRHYFQALRIRPFCAGIHHNLGNAMLVEGKLDEAVNHYRQALQFQPNYADTHNNLGTAFKSQGKLEDAITCYRQALQIKPDHAEAHSNLGDALLAQGKFGEAADHYRQALQIYPDSAGVLNNFAWFLATTEDTKLQNPTDAVKFAKRACELTDYKNPEILDTLAVAYADAGRFLQATETAEKAKNLAQAEGKKDLAREIQNRLQLYKTSQPYGGN